MESSSIETNRISSLLSHILFDNKSRFYQIFNLNEDVLFSEIEQKYPILPIYI